MRNRRVNKKHFFALSIIYFLIFLSSLALINYYANGILGANIVFSFSAISAIVSAYFHAKSKIKTKADELAKDIEEII